MRLEIFEQWKISMTALKIYWRRLQPHPCEFGVEVSLSHALVPGTADTWHGYRTTRQAVLSSKNVPSV